MIKQLLVIFFLFDYIPDWYKTQELCDRADSDIPILIVHFPVKYVTQKMCDKTVDISLGTLKIIPNWFVTKKWLKNSLRFLRRLRRLPSLQNYSNEDSGNVVFNCNEMGILNIDINNINLGNNFDEDDSDTNILIRLSAWHIKFEKPKALKGYLCYKTILCHKAALDV